MTHRYNPLFMDLIHRLISFTESRSFGNWLCFRLHARKSHQSGEPLGQRYFHSLGRKHSRLPQVRPSIKAIQTTDEVREKKFRSVKNVSHLATIRILYLADSSAFKALRHSTTLLLRSVKVLSIIVYKSNYVQLQHPRSYTTKRKYT